jgi:phosphoenolpyruvate synthase/pyruvate phosphate dikinase
MYIKNLNNSKDLSDIGNKCRNLALLTEFGFNVPTALGVTFKSYSQTLTPYKSAIGTIIKTNDYKMASDKIRELIMNVQIPNKILKSIKKAVSEFSTKTIFAVRSSGVVLSGNCVIAEDSNIRSLAGQYESFLNVQVNEIPIALKLCWASLFNERSLVRVC